LFLLALAGAARAQQPAAAVVVGQPATIGVDADSAATFGELLRGELGRQGFRVVPRGQTPPAACGDPGCAPELVRATGATGAVVVTLSRLGDKVIVKYDYVGANGQVYVSDRATALTVGDLEPISTRVARSIATGRPFAETIGVSTVTEKESALQKRRTSMFTKIIHFGTLLPVSSYAGSGTMMDIGFGGMWEFGGFAVDVGMEFAWTLNPKDEQPSAFNWQLNLGGRYFIDPEADTGVYLGGGVGLRAVSVNERRDVADKSDSKFGFGAYAGVGVLFLRTADVHLDLNVRYDVNVVSLTTSDGSTGAHGLLVTFGLAFTKLWFL
jgi:opacity protein-like surface antigen